MRIVGNQGAYTTAQLIPLLHRRLGIRATREQVRQWVARGIIEPLRDHDGNPFTEKGQSVFTWPLVARRLTDHGIGDKRVKAAR